MITKFKSSSSHAQACNSLFSRINCLIVNLLFTFLQKVALTLRFRLLREVFDYFWGSRCGDFCELMLSHYLHLCLTLIRFNYLNGTNFWSTGSCFKSCLTCCNWSSVRCRIGRRSCHLSFT